jgi:predicted phage terminase large subunit-like protein
VTSPAETLASELCLAHGIHAVWALDRYLSKLKTTELAALNFDWSFWARPEQLPPPGTKTTLFMGGRRSGKTRAASQYVLDAVMAGRVRDVLFVGTNENKVLKTMVHGPSGILTISPPWFRPQFLKSEMYLVFPNGATIQCLTSENPDASRAFECGLAWLDEVAEWPLAGAEQTIMNVTMANSAAPGELVFTTTPTRGHPILRRLVEESRDPSAHTVVLQPKSRDNPFADVSRAERQYGGTEMGRQELEGELLDVVEWALFKSEWILRAPAPPPPNERQLTVVAVDPSIQAGEYSGLCGIVVACLGRDGRFYVLEDASMKATPASWARRAVDAWQHHQANRIVLEKNVGESRLRETMRSVHASVPLEFIAARRGKETRAEPVSVQYQEGRVFHCGRFPELEKQMLEWVPGSRTSPDRLDALVWALTVLALRMPTPDAGKSGINQFTVSRGGTWL